MKNLRRACALLLCILYISTIVGCAKPSGPAELKLPSRQEDFFLLECENCDITIYDGISGGIFCTFRLLSAQPLTEADVELTTPEGFNSGMSLVETETQSFPYYVFQAYQGQSWTRLYELFLEGENSAAHYAERDQYMDAYTQLGADDIPPLYAYDLTLSWPNENQAAIPDVRELSVTVKGQTRTFPIDCFRFVDDFSYISGDGNLVAQSIARFDLNVTPGADGHIDTRELEFEAKEALEITQIGFVGDAAQIAEVSIFSAETGVDVTWNEGEGFPVNQGDTITLRVHATDPVFANTLTGSTRRHLEVRYTCNGTESAAYVELGYRMRRNPYEIYAAEVDGVDILSYYTEYYVKAFQSSSYS